MLSQLNSHFAQGKRAFSGKSNPQKKRVAVIGTGPSGMSINCAFNMAKQAGEEVPELVFFEKQSTHGGLWNFNWRTGVDSNGEPIHNTMYQGLFINAPKENYEYPYYTFMDHWGKATPSYPPRLAMRDYLETKFLKYGDPSQIKYETVVKNVTFDEETKNFTLTSRDYKEEHERSEEFSHVIVSTGHFSYPNAPSLPGYETFEGQLIHSHDQRAFSNYKDKTVMVIGTSYTAEDIASIAYKNGAKRIICSYSEPHGPPMPYKWPSCFETHTLPEKVDKKTVHFAGGVEIDVDVIVMCTGFKLHYPFMEEKLRLKSENLIVPKQLYKQMFHMDNNKVIYMGMTQQAYTFTMMDVQAFYAKDVILGNKQLPGPVEQKAWHDKWTARQDKFEGVEDMVVCQGDYITEIMNECSYPKTWDTGKTNANFLKWAGDKEEDIFNFRNKTFVSANTGVESVPTKTPWFENFDDSVAHYLNNGKE